MAITLSTITLPQGLRWSDEFAWSPMAQAEVVYFLTGSPLVEQSLKQAGRPITLIGGKDFAWMTRSEVSTLKTLLDTGAAMTLTLHDARSFTVIPAADEPLTVTPLPVVKESGPANPSSSTRYVLESLKLIEV